MKLDEWMSNKKMNATKVAFLAGVSISSVTRYLRGERELHPKIAEKISSATKGKVTICDLLFPNGLLEGAKR